MRANGEVFFSVFEYSRMMDALDKTLALNPDHLDALSSKGTILIEIPGFLGGDDAKGEVMLRQVIQEEPESINARMVVARQCAERGEHQEAYELAKDGVNRTADVSSPGKFDRATQWMFILCLPFAPYYTWSLLAAKRRVYRLDADGTLHAPEGTWTKEEIADIDMGRWMSKSIAHVVHSDGRRIKLDDYVYRNVHLIVGAIASKRYPEEWATDARRIPSERPASPEPAQEGAAEA